MDLDLLEDWIDQALPLKGKEESACLMMRRVEDDYV